MTAAETRASPPTAAYTAACLPYPPRHPFDYSNQRLLREKASECAELRELLVAVAGDLERLAGEYPELARRFLARSQRLRQRLWRAG